MLVSRAPILSNNEGPCQRFPLVTKTREPIPTPPRTPTSSRNPFRTHSRSKSISKVDINVVRPGTQSPDSFASSTSSGSYKSTMSVQVKTDELAWRSPYSPQQRPPLLKLSVPNLSRRPDLETIPGSPPYGQSSFAVDAPSFSLPSESAVRRAKLRRVKKVLGEGVPTDLIFPASPEDSDSDAEDSPLIPTPTSVASREWLLIDVQKPLPNVPAVLEDPLGHAPVLKAVPVSASSSSRSSRKTKEGRSRLYKDRPKDRPSSGAQRLESIKESAREAAARPASLTAVGVSASAGMSGRGKSRRFVEGDIPFDQIGTLYSGHMW